MAKSSNCLFTCLVPPNLTQRNATDHGKRPASSPEITSQNAAWIGWCVDLGCWTQLAQYLPATSNILSFQHRFELATSVETEVADPEWLEYVFQRQATSAIDETLLNQLPQRTRLQRAFVDHLRSGKHWYAPPGIRNGDCRSTDDPRIGAVCRIEHWFWPKPSNSGDCGSRSVTLDPAGSS